MPFSLILYMEKQIKQFGNISWKVEYCNAAMTPKRSNKLKYTTRSYRTKLEQLNSSMDRIYSETNNPIRSTVPEKPRHLVIRMRRRHGRREGGRPDRMGRGEVQGHFGRPS